MTKKKLGSNKVRQGKSSIPLKVTDKIELGQYPLNIEYEENLTYAKSNAYGTLFYGWKSFIHCPDIYVVEGDTSATLRANVFSNDDIVYSGQGKFKIKGKSQGKVPVVDGYARYQLDKIQSWKKKNPYYSFVYEEYLPLNYCSARSNNANIIYLAHNNRYAVIVKLITDIVMGYTGDTVRVIARIYKSNYASIIDIKDIPDNGYGQLTINGKIVGKSTINDAGYVTFDYKITETNYGVYPLLVEYVSQDEYYDDSACAGTLFVTSKKVSLPTVTAPQTWHPLGSTATIPLTFSDISSFDKIQVYIDDALVDVDDCDENGYFPVTSTSITLRFTIPFTYSSTCPWAYPGGHLMYIEYIDNVNHVTRRLYLPFLMIQYPTEIQLKSYGLDETQTMIVGNNLEGTVINTFNLKRLVEHGLITIDIDKLEVLLSLISGVDCIVGIKHPSNQLFVNETGTFKVTLQSNTTVPIPGRTVKLVTTDKTYTATTDKNGVATFTKKYTTSGNDDVYALFPSTETEAEKQTTPITIQILDLIESVLSNTVTSNTLVTSISPIMTGFPPSGTISATFKPVPIITITQPPNNSNYEVGNSIVIKAEVLLEYQPATDIPVILRLSRTKEDDTIQNYDSLQTKKTDKDGIVTYTTSSSIPSECKYTLLIEDTDDYTQCLSDALIINVTRRATSTNVKMENKNIGTASILVTVKAINTGEIVKTGTIQISVDDTIVGTSIISSESTSVPLNLDTPGTYNFVVKYIGDDTYASSTNTSLTGVKIVGKQTTISATVANNKVGSSSIDVTLLDENGNGVGEADIIVTLPDGSTCTGTTYSAGKVNIPVSSLLAGTHKLTVTFNGNSKYAPASTTLSITVVKTSVTLTATATSTPEYINDTIAFSVKAVTADNTPISDMQIVATMEAQYTDDTSTKEDVTISTNEEGIATYTKTCTKRGTYGIYFHYDGSNNYEQAQTTNTVYEITRRSATVSRITCSPASVTVGAKTSITAKLIDTKLGTGIQGKEVKISLTNGTITSDTYTATTDKDGNASIEYTVTNYGSYTITAIFEGDDTYDTATMTRTGLTVSGLSVNTNAYFTDENGDKITSIPIGAKAYIKGGCQAEDHTYPSQVMIKITKPDGTSTTRTAQNSKGYFSSPLYASFLGTIGTYTFEVYTEATSTYAESNHYTVELPVTKVPVTITSELTSDEYTAVLLKVTVANNVTYEGLRIPTGDITLNYYDSQGEHVETTESLLSDGSNELELPLLGSGNQTIQITYKGDDTHQTTSTKYDCIIKEYAEVLITAQSTSDPTSPDIHNSQECAAKNMPVGASALQIMCCVDDLPENGGYLVEPNLKITKPDGTIINTGTSWIGTNGYYFNCSDLNVGQYTVKIQIDDTYYYGQETQCRFEIVDNKITPTLTVTTLSTTPENTTLQITLTNRATGNVTISENNTILSTTTFSSNTNTQTVKLTDLTEGEHTFTLNYEGDSNYKTTSTTYTVNVATQVVHLNFLDTSNWTTEGLQNTTGTISVNNNVLSFNGSDMTFSPVYYNTSIQALIDYMPLSFTVNKNVSADGRYAMGLILPSSQNNGTDCFIGYMSENMGRRNGNVNTVYNEYTLTEGTPSKIVKYVEHTVVVDITDNNTLHIYYENGDNTYTDHTVDIGVDLSKLFLCFVNYRTYALSISDFKTNVELPTVDTTGGGANIEFYNTDNWSGTPTIDSTNQKVTMNGSNITYYSVSSLSELLSQTSDNTISLTYYHNGRDGRKSLGLYNPTINSWIGYCTPSNNGSNAQGVNEETSYTTTTTVTDASLWMRDGQETPLILQYDKDEDNIIMTYTSHGGTENVSVTIPLGGINLNNYYIAFYDYVGIGMYVKDITLGRGGAIMNSTLIATSTGGDTTDWIRRTGGIVETGTYDEKTCISIPSNYDWNDTVFNHEISNTGHYTLNVEFYITSGPFGLDMGLLRDLTTDNNKNITYVINNDIFLQYGTWNNEKRIVQGNDYKYDDNSWNLMTFEIVDGVIYLVLHNHLVTVSDAVTNPTWFGLRMFGGALNVGIYHIELRKYEE